MGRRSKKAPEPEPEAPPEHDDFGEPFEARSFGGEFVWAQAETYTSKVLRVRAGENVIVSTRGRRDMFVMLTGGRGVLELRGTENIDRIELDPAKSVPITDEHDYRLVAITDVEIFVAYAPE